MAIFTFGDIFGRLKDDMAKARKADPTKVASYVERLTEAKTDRPIFETIFAELGADPTVASADVIAVAHTYNRGGKKPGSKKAALAMIRKRFVEIVRTANKNKVAERARPW